MSFVTHVVMYCCSGDCRGL